MGTKTRRPLWWLVGAIALLLTSATYLPAQQTPDDAADSKAASVTQKPSATSPQNGVYSLSDTVSIELSRDWHRVDISQLPPPSGLAAYGPPFHLSSLLFFANSSENSIVQVALSDNPLVGHDPYWLDTQMHTANSGMSLPDFLFYFFLPPSMSCMQEVSQTDAEASRVSLSDGSSAADLQVFYPCPSMATLPDFYANQVSSGIIFRQGTIDGAHASGLFGNFYSAPMEQVDFAGMTFFIFEAQEMAQLTPEITTSFDLPEALQGANVEFFWAIGAASPFPFVNDPTRKDNTLIQVAYATSGVGPGQRSEFLELLHQLRAVHEEEPSTAVSQSSNDASAPEESSGDNDQ